MKIQIGTNVRGFLNDLFTNLGSNYEILLKDKKSYEKNSNFKILLHKIGKSKLLDRLGVIQTVKVNNSDADIIFSYNKFLKTDTKYVIYLETPVALVNYSTNRANTYLGKKKLKQKFNDPNLVGIICMTKACYETIYDIFEIPEELHVDYIYPFTVEPKEPFKEKNKEKSKTDNLNCLFVSKFFTIKGGGDLLKTFEKFKNNNDNIKLTIVTPKAELNETDKMMINSNPNITLLDFNLNKEELNEIYSRTDILVHPSRYDSSPLVILEAMKYANVVISTDLFAIPELVIDNVTGFLEEPYYRFYDSNKIPNDYVWYNRDLTINNSNFYDDKIINFLYDKLIKLDKDRDLLKKLSINAYNMATSKEFSEEYIVHKWNVFLKKSISI